MLNLPVSAVLAFLSAASSADPPGALPSPLDVSLFSFPGATAGPFSAASAGLAQADRWLGDEPAGNPAFAADGLSLTPALTRVSRQDLASDNRHFDQQSFFVDAAGGRYATRLGGLGLGAYLYQPMARLEDNAFERETIDSPTPPAVLQTDVTARELRGGLALSIGRGPVRLGAAGEWTHRSDRYHVVESSGAPDAGDREVEFSGDGIGFQAGARMDRGDASPGSFSIGAAVRFLPELTLDGEQRLALGTGDSVGTIDAVRESGWEGGVSTRVVVTPSFRVLASAGVRTAQDWQGFGVTTGSGASWSVAFDYQVPEAPWMFRLGLGRERTSDVAESNAGVIGIGLGWRSGSTVIDVGALRRNLERDDHPTSFDDRLLVSLGLTF